MRPRLAITAVFFLNGLVFTAWYARLPAVKQDLGLSSGEIAVALLAAPLGLLSAQPIVGAVVARRGSRRLVATAPLLLMSVALPAVATDLLTLAAALLVVGAANGTLDIAMNANGLAVERVSGHRLFSSLHAALSFGALGGALAAGAFAAAGVSPLGHLLAWGAAGALVALPVMSRLHVDLPSAKLAPLGVGRPSRRLVALSVIAVCTLLAEGAVFDWSGIFLASEAGATDATAALGLAVFSLTMGVGRLGGDLFAARLGAVAAARAGALLAAGGLALAVLSGDPGPALGGFAFMGLGLSVVFPLALRAAGRDDPRALAAVSAIGYTGFLAGPPLIGLLSELAGLRAALGLASAACLLAALLAPTVHDSRRFAAPTPAG